jgi:hypothetical protein
MPAQAKLITLAVNDSANCSLRAGVARRRVGLQSENIRIRVADARVHDAVLYPSRRVAGCAYSNAF